MKKLLLLLSLSTFLFAQGPEVTSWKINTTNATGFSNIPAGVQSVKYSNNYVYVASTGIPFYNIGPWAMNPNTASNQSWVFKIPRNPQVQSGAKTATGLGTIAVFTDGVSVFNAKDAFSYNNMNTWFQDAVVVEAASFDNCHGHPNQPGAYHMHQNPSCLYTANASQHSGILGYSFDGYPIYGPYAYTNTNGTGAIKRMVSSYQQRNITQRHNLAGGSTLPMNQWGPDVNATYPIGYYIEDYEYVNGLGDLDEYNGRFAVTPEYPGGTYAYYVTIDGSGNSAYPYIIGPSYYGVVETANTGPGGGHVTISESVTTYSPTATEKAQKLAYTLAPNPFSDKLTLHISGSASVELVNVMGQTVLSHNSSTNVSHIDTSTLPAGAYIARITSNGIVETQKFIKY